MYTHNLCTSIEIVTYLFIYIYVSYLANYFLHVSLLFTTTFIFLQNMPHYPTHIPIYIPNAQYVPMILILI
uniref:Uncharacterized protein n=1 Tax=Lepeophtheirus salmonis TaxID=72036 RepID=A0A0K2SXX4_LEPSM